MPLVDCTSVRERMLAEHAAIEERALTVLRAMREKAEPRVVTTHWHAFASNFLEHLDLEDNVVVPALYRRAPRKARGISEEHRYLRARTSEMSALLAGDGLTPDAVASFIEELRAHVRSEERVMYEWADTAMAEPERVDLLRKLTAV